MTGLAAPYLNTGHLVLIGGSEDKRNEMAVLRRIVALDGARTVAVIPTASDYPEERAADYTRAFSELGIAEVAIVDVRRRADAGRRRYLAMVRRADVVFFTGGDQVKLVESLVGTRLLEEVWTRFSAGATLAGTSAGAAAASDPMIYDGDGAGFHKGSVRSSRGFGFLEGITIDTHFVIRGRISRLAQFLSTGRSHRGLGLSEDTALIISPEGVAEVVGSGVVCILETGQTHLSNYHEMSENELLTIVGIRLGYLAPGTLFSLRTWRVCHLPPGHPRPEPALRSTKEGSHERLRGE